MITAITIQRFKCFEDLSLACNGPFTVLAGPNDAGKTTVLQAVAA